MIDARSQWRPEAPNSWNSGCSSAPTSSGEARTSGSRSRNSPWTAASTAGSRSGTRHLHQLDDRVPVAAGGDDALVQPRLGQVLGELGAAESVRGVQVQGAVAEAELFREVGSLVDLREAVRVDGGGEVGDVELFGLKVGGREGAVVGDRLQVGVVADDHVDRETEPLLDRARQLGGQRLLVAVVGGEHGLAALE